MDDAREIVDQGLAHLREIDRLSGMLYGTPRLGNHVDPLDELVYIILSRKTREAAYQAGFAALKRRFATWDELLAAPRSEVSSLIQSGGLVERKVESLYGALTRIRDNFGRCTLAPLRDWDDERVEAFLTSLPEVSRKSAYCVMMYSLGRDVLPVDTHVGRVLQRIQPLRELGLTLDGLDHKQLQSALAELVPPTLRYSLHVNLVAHGRAICRAAKPLCGECDLRDLCTTWREQKHREAKASDVPTVVDLFSGAGGLSEGFRRAGFRPVAAVELDSVAAKTFALNHPEVAAEDVHAKDIKDVSAADIRRALGRRRLDVLAGAPPCQGFSRVGMRSKRALTGYAPSADARNYLFEHLVALALELQPRFVIMENVPGMETAKKEDLSFLDSARRALEKQGKYTTSVWRVNATSFGVPQERLRCFLVAAADGMQLPAQPAGEYEDTRARSLDMDALPPVTITEALFDLPPRGAGTGTAVDRRVDGGVSETDLRARRYLRKFGLADGSAFVFNHYVRYHNPNDLELYALLRPGEDSVHAIERHGRGDLMKYRRDVFDDKYARLRPDRPSKTIVAHLAKDGNGYIHPSEVRSLSIRECARLQSFRDDYKFCGPPSDQWVQIGNAVPPLVAESIARALLGGLRRAN